MDIKTFLKPNKIKIIISFIFPIIIALYIYQSNRCWLILVKCFPYNTVTFYSPFDCCPVPLNILFASYLIFIILPFVITYLIVSLIYYLKK